VEVMDDIEFDRDDGEDVGNVCDDGDDDVVMVVETMIDDVEAIDETEFDREEEYVGAFDIVCFVSVEWSGGYKSRFKDSGLGSWCIFEVFRFRREECVSLFASVRSDVELCMITKLEILRCISPWVGCR
jgi:hypothetical protein